MRVRSQTSAVVSTLALAALVLLLPGCDALRKSPVTTPTPPPPAAEPDCSAFEEQIDALTHARADGERDAQDLQDRLATLQLRLLEKNAVIETLRDDVANQQKEFDQAIAEVVRSKAKLRSVESKAEAASDLAEAEIALKSVRARYPQDDQPVSLDQVAQLVKMGGQEFQRGNYGGSLYLTSQARAKLRVAEVRARFRANLDPVPGEVRFATPVQLTVVRNSNLREGPSLDTDVLTTLPKGSSLIGYSYLGSWVRVESGDHSTGWVFQGLLGEIE